MFDFRADNLVLDMIISPTINIPLLPVVLCAGLRSYGFSTTHLNISLVSMFSSCLSSHVSSTL